jgi:SHS2 domain-containing protein
VTIGHGFRFLAHTADMGIEARAASREAVVEEITRGLITLMFGNSRAEGRVKARLIARGNDPVELLVSCLNEVVYWSEKDNLVPSALDVELIDDGELQATISGEPFDPARHNVERQVKSVTYHQACLDEKPEGWYARVYVDL